MATNDLAIKGYPKVGDKLFFSFGNQRNEYKVFYVDKTDENQDSAYNDKLRADDVLAIVTYEIVIDGCTLYPSSYLIGGKGNKLTEPRYI